MVVMMVSMKVATWVELLVSRLAACSVARKAEVKAVSSVALLDALTVDGRAGVSAVD